MFLDLKTKDGVDSRLYGMACGLWPRFNSYIIREKGGRQFIGPAENAKLEIYDPFAALNTNNLAENDNSLSANREMHPPYIHFLSLFNELEIDLKTSYGIAKADKLTTQQKSVICDWCSRYGLLGILFHEVKMFRLPYVDRQPEGNMYKSIAFSKRQGKWYAHDFHFQGTQLQNPKAVTSSFQDWQKGEVELESCTSSSFVAGVEDAFYWSDPYWIADNYFPFSRDIINTLKTSDSNEVWKGYCEPLDFFWDKLTMLTKGLVLLAHSHTQYQYEEGVRALTRLLGESPVFYGFFKGKVVPNYRTPSLISAYSLMALEDAARGSRIFQCENEKCRSWFTSKRINAKFCTAACNTVQQQRKHRKRKKNLANMVARAGNRFCKGCGESMEGKRPQAKFCNTTCGNTFRKREQRARQAQKKSMVSSAPK